MLKRLFIGLLKGAAIGAAIGAGFMYGLHWMTVESGGLLAFLMTMGASGTTGVFAGKPPWREGAWIEALLKGTVGVGIGAGLYYLASRYAALPIQFPEIASPTAWTSLPILFLPAAAGAYGAMVELDNTDDGSAAKTADKKKGAPSKPARTRVEDAIEDVEVEEQESARTKPVRRR